MAHEEEILIYCIFSRNLIHYRHVTHIRQFREDKDGNQSAIFPRERAIIEPNGDTFTARTTHSDIIAISTSLEVVKQRIRKAQPDVEIVVHLDAKELTLKQYTDAIAPTIYRITFGTSEVTGDIYVIDRIRKGRLSKIEMFGTTAEVEEHIHNKQGDDPFFYIHLGGRRRLNLDIGGLDFFELNAKQADTSRLSEVLKTERDKRISELSKVTRSTQKDQTFDVNSLYEEKETAE